jgi:hypothetical protein
MADRTVFGTPLNKVILKYGRPIMKNKMRQKVILKEGEE